MTFLPAATVIGTNLVIDYGSEEAARAALDAWVPEPDLWTVILDAVRAAGVSDNQLNAFLVSPDLIEKARDRRYSDEWVGNAFRSRFGASPATLHATDRER